VVEADPEQLKRVFINLVENAFAAIEGKGTITFTTSLVDSEQTVQIRVGDDGRGLPAHDRDKLFLPYFSARKGGTGLGLAIVSDIVSEHRGEIRVEDNTTRGTVFIVDLPCRGRTARTVPDREVTHEV
jgi:two-component system nitrogen regulation sensor histidine kinase NtrY